MSMTDPIADMLTRIRNALATRRRDVEVPSSRLKRGIAEVLKREGFIDDYLAVEAGPKSVLRLKLRYDDDGGSVIRKLERVSRPGRRIYRSSGDMESPVAGQGIHVVSTDRGVLSDREAREANAGGEVLAKIW